MSETQLAFIGAGNMAEAIARGLLKAKVLEAGDMVAADPADARRALFQDELGIEAVSDAAAVAGRAATVLLAVKPQQFDAAIGPVADRFGPGTLLLSICAGLSTTRIEAAVAGGTRVVRSMPNTPMLVGCGMSAICAGAEATEADLDLAERLLGAASTVVRVPEELMDAVTAVSGSGPAYFFYLAELLAEAAKAVGLPEGQAVTLARTTFEGAARLLAETGADAADLRRKVTSPGGTTEAALKTFQAKGLADVIAAGVTAARDRGRELGG